MRRVLWELRMRWEREQAEFDQVLWWFMHDLVDQEEPPATVWQNIQAGLRGGPVAFPKRSRLRAFRLPPLAQAMGFATLFLAVISMIVNVNLPFIQQDRERTHAWVTGYPSAPVVLTEEDALSSRHVFLDRYEQRMVQKSLIPTSDPVLMNRHRDE